LLNILKGFSGKGIFLFSDPSGAKSCLALASILKKNHIGGFDVVSNKKYDFYTDWDVEVTINEQFDLSLVENKPDWIFTGTSHPESSNFFEVKQIAKARQLNIYIYSFIDHWVNFRLRYEGLLPGEFPDEIWVIDKEAKKLAIEEGLPEEQLTIRENPYHYYLSHYWKPKCSEKDYLAALGVPIHHFHILFAPDPFSLRGRDKQVGFSEIDALRDLLNVIGLLNNDIYLLIKAHPLQPHEQLINLLNASQNVQYQFITDGDVPELINASDLVIGMYSNLLLEAFVLNKKVIRYFPGNKTEDLLRHSKLSETCSDKSELEKQINHFING
jgi:CDP-glycerol glycerophosphotransferase (TagB/SpsB family)